ncbi:hypothetical protein [Tardiphaga sp.]|uniref:hypothetical protein n=1 Tax=Tardiphaga sp. TaxID=1926292 RepID=UPI00352A0887
MTSFLRQYFGRALVLRLLPISLCLAFSVLMLSSASVTLLQSDFIDPYVYTAYINDYFGTYQRFGQTYYSSRVAFIFVDAAFIKLFGQTAGPFLCRIALLTLAAFSALQIARRFFGLKAGIVIISWLCLIPWLLRSISWMYCDGFATVYTIIGLAFLLTPTQRRKSGHFAAGLTFSFAANCNLHLLVVIGAFVPSWFLLNYHDLLRTKLLLIASALLGFLVGYAILQAAFSATIGSYSTFLEAASIGTANSLLGGAAAAWFKPMSQIINEGLLIFLIPMIFAVTGAYVLMIHARSLRDSQRRFAGAAVLYVCVMLAATFIFHYIFKHGLVSLFFYEVYFLPSCVLVLIFVAGIASAQFPRHIMLATGLTCSLLIALWLARDRIDVQLPFSGWAWLVGWITFCVGALALSRIKASSLTAPVALVMLCVTTYGIVQWQPGTAYHYAIWPNRGTQGATERGVYQGAIFLQKFVNTHVPAQAPIGFWYGDKPSDHTLNAVQSIFLWGYTRLHSYRGLAMPEIDPAFRERVGKKEYVALIARSEGEIDAGLAALRTLPAHPTSVVRAHFADAAEGYYIALAKVRAP